MVIAIPAVLDRDELARCRSLLERAPWVDGNITSGHQSALAKHNRLDVLGTGLYACLGVYASVTKGGRLEAGSAVELT